MRIERVIGIDVSLTSTGIAVVHRRNLTVAFDTIQSQGRRGDSIEDRSARISAIARNVEDWLNGQTPILTVIEAPVPVRVPGGSTWDRAGLWWEIVHCALIRGPVALVSPATRARWATGRGNADKAAVAAAMARYVDPLPVDSSDEADALALAYMGAQKLGWVIATGSVQYAAIDSVKWPELVQAELGEA